MTLKMTTMNHESLSTRPLPAGEDINVVIVGRFSYPQGMAATKRVQHFIDALQSHGFTVTLLLLDRGAKEVSPQESSGWYRGTLYRKIGSGLTPDVRLVWRLPLYLWEGFICLLRWKVRKSKNICFCYGSPSIENIVFVVTAKLLGYRVVFDIVEDYAVFGGGLSRLSRIKVKSISLFERFLHLIADGVVVISTHLYKKYSTLCRNRESIRLIPVSAQADDGPNKHCFHSPVRLVYSGSFATKDGVDDLIDAFESVRDTTEDIKLFLTGKGSDERMAHIRKRIERNPAIHLVGYLDDEQFYDFLRDADILCMTRTSTDFANAGFPFKLGEYLATGNPVIASRNSDVTRYLEHMKDALLTTPGDVRDIEEAIRFLITQQDHAIRIGRSGREKCRMYFNPLNNGRLLVELFRSL